MSAQPVDPAHSRDSSWTDRPSGSTEEHEIEHADKGKGATATVHASSSRDGSTEELHEKSAHDDHTHPQIEVNHVSFSVDVDEKAMNADRQYRTWKIFHSWKFELWSAFLATALLVIEYVLCGVYDHKYLVLVWSHSWKINSVFACLTTLLEANIMFFTAASIGQLRWHWFTKKQHRMDWLEILTDASRPAGAMKLLVRPGMHKQFAVFGSIIVILLLGINTFTQQVVEVEIDNFSLGNGTGWVPINTNYTWYDRFTTQKLGNAQVLPDMAAAIQNGFFSFSSNVGVPSVEAWVGCEGASCDFGTYQSIAVCSKCVDISHTVHNPCPSGNCTDNDYYTLSGGVPLSLMTTRGQVNVSSDVELPSSQELAAECGPLIVRSHAITQSNIDTNVLGKGAIATECAAWFCVQTYTSNFNNITFVENIQSNWTDTSVAARTSYDDEYWVELTPPNCYINGTKPSNSSYCSFWAGSDTLNGMQNYIAKPPGSTSPFPAFLTGSAEWIQGPNGTYLNNYTTLTAGGLSSSYYDGYTIGDQYIQGFLTMGDQMTVAIRGEPAGTTPTGYFYGEWTYGTATVPLQRFNVRWGWLAFPTAVLFFSLVFFVTTVIKTRNDDVWKQSILPMIFHSFGETSDHGYVGTVRDMRRESKGRKMQLGRGEQGTAFQTVESENKHGEAYERTAFFAGKLAKPLEIVAAMFGGG